MFEQAKTFHVLERAATAISLRSNLLVNIQAEESSILKVMVEFPSETLGPIYQTTWSDNPNYLNLIAKFKYLIMYS
jgi:hypothetical protein